MTTVLLVRHGETMWNREKRLQGWAQTTLTDRGRSQATNLGTALAHAYDITAIHASDLTRARQTASLLQHAIRAPLSLDSGWRERNFGCCQGLTYDEFTEQYPDLSLSTNGADAVRRRPRDGETLHETRDRVMSSWTRVTANANESDTILIVSHGGPICLVLGALTGCTIPESFRGYSQANCAVTEIRVGDSEAQIVRENDTQFR